MNEDKTIFESTDLTKGARKRRSITSLLIVAFVAGCHLISDAQKSPVDEPTTSSDKYILTTKTGKEEKKLTRKTNLYKKKDLWKRVRKGLNIDIRSNNERIKAELKHFKNNQYYFDRLIDQAKPYLQYIVNEVQSKGLPMEIALLPALESSFDPYAYSHGRAAGLWQFLPYIGRHYGLKQNWWYDGRRDVVESTRAALYFLDELHDVFNDWELALAAYNAGRGTVSAAIRRNKHKGKPTDYWSLKLPRETSRYVPKLIALSQVIINPKKYGIQLPDAIDQPYFAIIDTKQQIDLARVARLGDIYLEELQKLNPAFNRWATAPEGPHRLLVPIDKASNLEIKISKLQPSERLQWTRYTIQPGDSLALIARRFNSSVNFIKEVNGITDNIIVLDKSLLIPTPLQDLSSYPLSATQRQLARESRIAATGKKRVVHTVKKGDSFWQLSKKYKVGIHSLAKWNGMAPSDPLTVGKNLVLWESNLKKNSSILRKVNYRVRSGDSLTRIADKFNVQIGQITEWNTLKSKVIRPGQQLTLYVDVTNTN